MFLKVALDFVRLVVGCYFFTYIEKEERGILLFRIGPENITAIYDSVLFRFPSALNNGGAFTSTLTLFTYIFY